MTTVDGRRNDVVLAARDGGEPVKPGVADCSIGWRRIEDPARPAALLERITQPMDDVDCMAAKTGVPGDDRSADDNAGLTAERGNDVDLTRRLTTDDWLVLLTEY